MDRAFSEVVIQSFFNEFEKVAATLAQSPSGNMQAPGMGGDQAQNQQMGNEDGRAVEVLEDERSPAHGVVASRVEQLDPKRAIGIPVLQPPPGYVYNPELAAFVPNEQDPGWMAVQDALQAQQNKGWYDQGQNDVQADQAQQEIDQTVEQDAQASQEQAMAEQDQQAQMQQVQQTEQMKAQQKAMGEAARAGFGPEKKPAAHGTKKKSKPAAKKAPEKGVTIKIGK